MGRLESKMTLCLPQKYPPAKNLSTFNFFCGKKDMRRDVIPAGSLAIRAAIPRPSPIFRLKNNQEKRMVTRTNMMLTQEQDLPIIR